MSKFKSQRELFFHVWKTRPHYCSHCKTHLGEEMKAHYFSHDVGKGAHPELKLEESNLSLRCIPCHREYDHGGKARYERRKR